MEKAEDRRQLLAYLNFIKDWTNIAIKLTRGVIKK